MGKGDQRTKKGKRNRGSYGRTRPKKKPNKNSQRRTAPRGR